MSKLRFQGGPWDGVEFEADFAPDAIRFKDLNTYSGKGDKPGTLRIGSNIVTHHVYLQRDDPSTWPELYLYRYEPNGEPHWESNRKIEK